MKKILSIIICLVVVISLTGCKKETESVHLYELKDSSENVKLVFENEIDKDIKLETRIGDNYINLSDSIKKYTVHNISLVKYNGNEKEKVNPGKIIVLVKIPDGYNKNKLAVYYVPNYVIMNSIDYEIDGKYIKFESENLGSYAIAELK